MNKLNHRRGLYIIYYHFFNLIKIPACFFMCGFCNERVQFNSIMDGTGEEGGRQKLFSM